jgi:hypothetical protein
MLIEALVAAILVSGVAFFAWRIGKKIGFSLPWKLVSIGFLFVAVGRILEFVDQIYIKLETPALTDVAAISLMAIIAGFILVIIGLRLLYLVVCKELK